MSRRFLDGYDTYDSSDGFGDANQWRNAFYQRMGADEAQQVLSQQADTPYSILGVAPGATPAEIKAAFRELIKEWHPDRNPHRLEEAETQSKRIIAAFTHLSNLKS